MAYIIPTERHEQYETGEEQRPPEQEELATSPHPAVVPDSLEIPPTTEVEEPVKEPTYITELTEEALQESYEPEDTSGVQELADEYHEVTGETTNALEDEDDYEGTNAGEEDESTKSQNLDADQVHDPRAEDTDAPATVTGHGSEYGGEQTEYVEDVQPEEYDERYGEDLPERAGGASPVQYGEPPHYEEEKEQDTSTAVDETQAVLPGLDEDGGDDFAATPVPPPAVLESEVSELVDNNVADVSEIRMCTRRTVH